MTLDIMGITTDKQQQDYVSAALDIKQQEYKSNLLIPTIINNRFSNNKALNNTIVHSRLGHAMDEKIRDME